MTDTQELLEKAKNLAYFYLKFRPRSEHEISEYLTKKKRRHKLTDEIIKKAIAELKDEKLIDDEAFIKWHVDRRSRAKPKSQMLLSRELMRFGIPKEMIIEHFESQELDEEALARKALAPRWARILRLPKEKRFQKAASFLQSRGFFYGVIKNTIAEMEKEDYN
ncbi:hypothetical protein A3G67_00085 [Candidatus Roizmanbacteria bacterium RIFCSPLOWO2_12_FULL_40_12]|uniref:Regulatory protein RecX n=1 Tax=Candidatus Roizmanbacteria bacterium RIFCSPLOWO2_01_FULL_40_42 TaxID=1802066 RepID=A0A1F7J2G9_9BACT|nr:MAG: hypothetical protein A2779_02255 [Candidatus Roizmanbacteria bacterium RIFCSPHIGHO2_01_FULL_40_98]OGK28604.1 MAG: hypothetical protein A3C31_03170 [Candidatus Roizmanbacteria bacterium RIFCSPHIGHO2_02_FULL_40_53]OGK29884.1 MAG: hypothetical protein A2W49_04325 [Candidatus Roizmanbacteria bacterium RIFCSPHIGHO2_12_41_18]OGK36752.1 MAG: hypothetical protein A3E69_03375 [Candidatus Roizmanbacteria bacterium RIFCSPHIGHO2_12_FULL_40_130]OGK49803.1 MAG: hypothetical protein A3B50_03160 [Candi